MNEKTECSLAGGPEEGSSRGPMLVMILAAFAFIGAVGVIIYGYLSRAGWVGATDKTFWDYLELLIVPAALAIGVALLNQAQERTRDAQEDAKEQERARDAAQREQERQAAEEARRNREQEIDDQRAQDAALQAYLDQMAQLLLDEARPLRQSKAANEEARRLARTRTLTVLSRLDGRRQGSVIRFLSEEGLINRADPVIALGGTRRKVIGANSPSKKLGDTIMPAVGLGDAALTLGGAKLEQADLQGADLNGTDLSHVDLSYANLTGADLTEANLKGSLFLGATLMGADLRGATLDNAILPLANLFRASIPEEEIQRLAARGSLPGAMIPDGSRPFPVPPEAEALLEPELREQPDSPLAQKKRELEELSRQLEQQARKRKEPMPNSQ
jgi:hypothetical protein